MRTSLDPGRVAATLGALSTTDAELAAGWPGEPERRQPVHTVYGGAHLFRAGTARKLGDLALAALRRYGPDPEVFGAALGVPEGLREAVHARVIAKLEREPVEDYRIDFEDGYGWRPDDEEDRDAVRAAGELAKGSATPCVGIRIKPVGARAIRTLDLFVSELVQRAGALPPGFVVTLPKPRAPTHVAALADVLDGLEAAVGLPHGAVTVEVMVEATQALMDAEGRCPLPAFLRAARGRMVGAHLGPYDLTASANVTAPDQRLDHPLCDHARHRMTLAFASTGVFLSDGPTSTLPIGPHRGEGLTAEHEAENRAVVHGAWRLHHDNVRRALGDGFFQGWDLHPGQLPARYGAVHAFFLEGLAGATRRLANFVEQAARATHVGAVFDDAATGRGLLNWFQRGLSCGAVTEQELAATGLTRQALDARSFVGIASSR